MFTYKIEEVFLPGEGISVTKHSGKEDEKMHKHEFIEIVYIAEGHGIHQLNKEKYPVNRGDLLFVNYGQVHSFTTDETMVFYNLLMKPEFISNELVDSNNAFEILSLTAFEEFSKTIDFDNPLVSFYGKDIIEVENLISAMESEYSNKNIGYKSILNYYLSAFLIHIFRRMSIINGDSIGKRKIIHKELFDYIMEHSSEKLSLNMLANKCFYNPNYFSRVFKEYTGETLTDYIHSTRCRNACELLKTTNKKVDDIALAVGYSNITAFYKQFRKRMGQSPANFRKLIK